MGRKYIVKGGKKIYMDDLEIKDDSDDDDDDDDDDAGKDTDDGAGDAGDGGDGGDAKEDGDGGDDKPSDTPDASKKEINSAAKKAAKGLLKELGLDKFSDLNEKVDKLILQTQPEDSKLKEILNGKDYIKDADNLTKDEKIVGFFHALVRNNEPALKALSEGTDADGGFLFPDEFKAEVIRELADLNVMRGLVRIIPMKRDVMNIPTLASGPQLTWTAENVAKSTTTAHFGNAVLTARKCAAILYASDELIDDSDQIDVVQLIITLFAEKIAEEEERVITRGNGTTEPTGLEQARIDATIASRAAVNQDFDDIIDLEHDLPSKYRRNAVYLVHNEDIRELRKLKDSDGRYLWADPVADGQPATFHGKKAFENNHLVLGTLFFGDFRRGYWLGDRQRMTVKISQDTTQAFTQDMTAIRIVFRIAGNVVFANAIRALTGLSA